MKNLKLFSRLSCATLMLSLLTLGGCSDDLPDVKPNVPDGNNTGKEDNKNEEVDINGPKEPVYFIVASDVHVMDPALLIKDGEAFQDVLNSDRKLLQESYEISKELFKVVLKKKPDFFMICGDLTKDGEKTSHLMLQEELQKLKDAGIQTLVVPGNHDINNPHAKKYDGKIATSVEHITPEEFKEIYKNFGYDESKMVEKGPRLSYVYEPVEGLWVIGVDACVYENNIKENYPYTGGRYTKETLAWVIKTVKEAKEKGKKVIAFQHHGLIEHFPLQAFIAKEYVVENFEQQTRLLQEAGLNFMFTGHFHAQDIVKKQYPSGTIYDIETGSTVTYPCPYREVRFDSKKMEITSDSLIMNSEVTNNESLQVHAYKHLDNGIPGMANYLVDYLVGDSKDPTMQMLKQVVPQMAAGQFRPMIMDIYTHHLKGDEKGLSYNPDPKDKNHPYSGDLFNVLKEMIAGMAPKYASYIPLIEPALYDTAPGDNNIIIYLNGEANSTRLESK